MTWYLINNSDQLTPGLVLFCGGSLLVWIGANLCYDWLKSKYGKK